MSTTINIQTTESQPFILLPTFINSKGPFEFVLDTGAGMSIMTEEIASIIDVEDTEVKEALGAAGKKIKILLGKVDSISIGESKVENVQVGIVKELPKCVGHGVIGYNFLKKYILTIDYKYNILTLTSPTDKKSDDHLLKEFIPFRIAKPDRPILLVDVLINDQGIYQFILDTGASQTIVSPELAQIMSIKGTDADSIIGVGGNIQSSVGTLESLSIGKACVENITIIVSDIFSSLSQAADANMDGILGYNFLSKFKLVINYPNEILLFEE